MKQLKEFFILKKTVKYMFMRKIKSVWQYLLDLIGDIKCVLRSSA